MTESFKYTNGNRMCAAGQRRAALTALDLTLEGAEGLKDVLLKTAAKTQTRLGQGADVNKHDEITYVVTDAVTSGEIKRYIDPDTGDYVVETYDGRVYPANIYDDLVNRKRVY